MYLKKTLNRQNRIFLSFVQGYRDENGKSKQKTIKNIGFLDELEKRYDNPIDYFKNIAKEKTKEQINEITIKNINNLKIDNNSKPKNLGYAVLKRIYNELGIKEILDNVQKKSKIQYNLNDILSMLVFMRILKPGSKKDNYENMDMLFENYDFSLDDLYRALSDINPLQKKIQKVMWESTKDAYNRKTDCTYYDCTNYYFEIEYNDEDIFEIDAKGNLVLDKDGVPKIKQKGYRKRGPEKNHRPDPIIEMGLLMDSSFIPLSFYLFPGNVSEKKSLLPHFNNTRHDFNLGRTIVVADRGLNTADNIIKVSGTSLDDALKRNGYVYGQSVRGVDEEFKQWVLKQEDYITEKIKDENDNEIMFKHKSRVYPKKFYIVRDDKGTTSSGNKRKDEILVDQKQMVYFSQKYADKQKRDRDMIIAKAKDLIKNPAKYNKSTAYGCTGYINNLTFVKSTGEIADGHELSINQDRIDEEAKYDGYYSIVTSEEKLSDIEIRKIYRGLSKIEETFKVTKSGFESRPVYVSTAEHIESHFLTCFISLVIVRLLEKKLDNKYSFNKIIDAIRRYNSSKIEYDYYLNTFRNDVIIDFEKAFDIDLSQKYITLSNIKKIINNSNKSPGVQQSKNEQSLM